MNWNVLRAIFWRNFVSYFASPTGYVFICVFVLLSSFAAFWPHEFFNSNLANLDQLNRYLPYIMLVFIPAITMSIWAEERRLGTDELLLTIPASDIDVVLGKYLAAVAIFSVSLVFSMLANFWVLIRLGIPDMGLFVGTYIGYWFVGLAMLAVGMVASFLTSNLTVGFILGALFNAPLAFSGAVDVIIKNPTLVQSVKRWSVASQFYDFQRGVLSLSSTSYFVMIAIVMIYLSVVLIGRRHWSGGRDGQSMFWHYATRTLALVGIVLGANYFLSSHDAVRLDVTSERLSSLSADTRTRIQELDAESPVTIEAFVSPEVPAEYVQTRLNLLSMLDELKSLGSGKITVVPHTLENFSQEAVLAEQKYGIKPQTVITKRRGSRTQEDIFMGVALTCGLDKVVLPFIDKGIPVEYELLRSICTVAQEDRQRVGVLKTDVALFSQFNMQSFTNSDDALLIQELKKQYEVIEVDPSSPIQERYDVLLAVQPSSLGLAEMENFIDAVKKGQPTAIFEDPFPLPNFYPNVPATSEPKRPPQQMMGMMGGRQPPPQPKGNIRELWDLLGVSLVDDEIIWQDHNPYPKGQQFIKPEWVFVDQGSGAAMPFSDESPITSRLQQVLLVFPGSWQDLNTSDLDFQELAVTGSRTGTIRFSDIMQFGGRSPVGRDLSIGHLQTNEKYVLAAHIQGAFEEDDASLVLTEEGDDETSAGDEADADDEETDEDSDGDQEEDHESSATEGEINVVLVADIDCLASAFFFVRAQGEEEDADIAWEFDNVTFVLNILDVLAGDDRFLEIRKRRRAHRTLVKVEQRTEIARNKAAEEREGFVKDFETARADEQKKFDDQIKEIEDRTDIDPRTKAIYIESLRRDGQRKLDTVVARLQDLRSERIESIERDLSLEIRRVQDRYKLLAVLIPPIPPLLLAFFIFFHRRSAEREGVAKSRLR